MNRLTWSAITVGAALLSGATGCLGTDPMATPQREINTRQSLREIYVPLTGTYRGQVWDESPEAEPFPIELRLYLVEEASGVNENSETVFRPSLRGYYRRLDFGDYGVGDYTLNARFIRETSELILESHSQQGVPGRPPGVGYLSASGKLNGKRYTGELRDHRRALGRFELIRVNPADLRKKSEFAGH